MATVSDREATRPQHELVERAQAGDEQAFHQLFLDNREMVARVVHRIMGPSPEIEDVVQDVFVHVYRSISRFRGDSKFTTWLYRLSANVTKMHLRKKKSRPRFADKPLDEERSEMELGPAPDRPDRLAERQERISALYRLLDQLSDKKRTVIALHDFEGISAGEIAEILDISVMTVRTRLFYARKELYAALSAEPALESLVDAVADRISTGKAKR